MFIQLLASLIVTAVVLVIISQVLYVADRISAHFQRRKLVKIQEARREDEKEYLDSIMTPSYKEQAKELRESTVARANVTLSEVQDPYIDEPLHPSVFDFYDKMINPKLFLADMTKEEFNEWIDNAIDPPSKKDMEALEKRLLECEMYEHCGWLKEREDASR